MNPEVKIILHVHEDALASAPTADDLKALLGFEPSHLVIDRQVLTAQRVRAPELGAATTLAEQLDAWIEATQQGIDAARMTRLRGKLAEVEA